MALCETMIEDAVRNGATQRAVAQIYALALRSVGPIDWSRMNARI